MIIHLGCPLPDTSSNLPRRRPGNRSCAASIWSCSRRGLPCHCRYRQRGALLPHPFTLTCTRRSGQAVCFLWHFPWSRLRRTLSGAVLPWSPDFPPPLERARSPDYLTPLLITAKPTLGQARLGPDTRHKPASASRHRPARPRKTV